MRTKLQTFSALLFTGVLGATAMSSAGAAPLSAAAPDIVGFDGEYSYAETWAADGSGCFTSAFTVEVGAAGDVFAIDGESTPDCPGVMRMSATGEVLGRWDYSNADAFPTDEATKVYGADIDSAGNLHLLVADLQWDLPPTVLVYSPSGELLKSWVVDLVNQRLPIGLAVIGDSTYVASNGAFLDPGAEECETEQPECETGDEEDLPLDEPDPAWGLGIDGFDSSGVLVNRFEFPGLSVLEPENFVRTADGNLAFVTDDAEADIIAVSVMSTDGDLLHSWGGPQVEPGVYLDADRIAIGPQNQVALIVEGEEVHLLTLDGTPTQVITLSDQIEDAYSMGLGFAGDNGRLYVGTDFEESLLVYDRIAAAEVEADAWSATQCVAFSEQVVATGGTPAASFFEVTAGALPAGVRLDEATGVVSGTPTVAGAFSATIAAHNGVTPAGSETMTLAVAAANCGAATNPTDPATTAPGGAAAAPQLPGTSADPAVNSGPSNRGGSLASTGVTVVWTLAVALVLALAGTGLVIARRRAEH